MAKIPGCRGSAKRIGYRDDGYEIYKLRHFIAVLCKCGIETVAKYRDNGEYFEEDFCPSCGAEYRLATIGDDVRKFLRDRDFRGVPS